MTDFKQNINNNQQEDKDSEENKALLEKVKAAITVFKHTNNRIPTLEEVTEMLGKEQQPNNSQDNSIQPELPQSINSNDTDESSSISDEEDNTPKCLKFIVLHGQDTSKPAFFSDPSANMHFDVSSGNWSDNLPDIAQHLGRREVKNEDIFNMIIHGIMDGDDFTKLDQAGMIDDKSRAIKEKIDSMREMHNSLEKSINEFTGDTRPEANMNDFDDEEGEALSTFGLLADKDESEDMPGENVLAQIFDNALGEATCPKMLKMVRNEIAKALGKNVEELFPVENKKTEQTEDLVEKAAIAPVY